MYKIKSDGKFYIKDRGWVFTCESPVTAERTYKAVKEAIGNEIEIDGHVYEIIGLEMFQPGIPVHIGEPLGILVKGEQNDETKESNVGT
jgi:hypothetical protein